MVVDGLIPAPGVGQVERRIGPRLELRVVHNPVRQSAVPYLGVAVGSDAQVDFQPQLLAQLQEAAEIPAALPRQLALELLVQVPDTVSRHDVDARGFRFHQRVAPVAGMHSREMDFAHHRQAGHAAYVHVEVVYADFLSRRAGMAQGEVSRVG